MSNKIIQSLWVGSELSNAEILCINSYVQNNHEFHLYSYENLGGIPEGVILKDANELIPQNRIFRDSAGSLGAFADWFRLKMLVAKGGWWVDMDTICLRPFNIDSNYCFSSDWNIKTNSKHLNCTYIKAPVKCPYLAFLLKRAEMDINSGKGMPYCHIGIYLWREMFALYPILQSHVSEPAIFCPVNYYELSNLICKQDRVDIQDSLAVHLWNELWRRGNLDKDAVYHPESIYEQLKNRYLKGDTNKVL